MEFVEKSTGMAGPSEKSQAEENDYVQLSPNNTWNTSSPGEKSPSTDKSLDLLSQPSGSQSSEQPPPYTPEVSIPKIPSPHPPSTSRSGLQKPVAIPATLPEVGSPFLRAYPPVLLEYKLPKESFLAFLDNLNRVAVASPPIQILGMAGNVVGFVPISIAQFVGMAVGAAAKLATFAVSKGRTELYLKQANKDIFAPRGLKVEIAKIDALAKIAGIPILDAAGNIDRNEQLLTPIKDIGHDTNVSGQQRRLSALQPWIAELEVASLPKSEAPRNLMSKLEAATSERQARKGEGKLLKQRHKAEKHHRKDVAKAQEDYRKEMWKLDKDEQDVRRKVKDPERLASKLEQINYERQLLAREYEQEVSEVDADRVHRDKEERGIRKILWVIIRPLDADSGSGPNPHVDEEG